MNTGYLLTLSFEKGIYAETCKEDLVSPAVLHLICLSFTDVCKCISFIDIKLILAILRYMSLHFFRFYHPPCGRGISELFHLPEICMVAVGIGEKSVGTLHHF